MSLWRLQTSKIDEGARMFVMKALFFCERWPGQFATLQLKHLRKSSFSFMFLKQNHTDGRFSIFSDIRTEALAISVCIPA